MQLRDLEASFEAQEVGGTASVVSKVNLWKVREQAALASGEKTVSQLLHTFPTHVSLFLPIDFEFIILTFIVIRLANSILKRGCVNRIYVCFFCLISNRYFLIKFRTRVVFFDCDTIEHMQYFHLTQVR